MKLAEALSLRADLQKRVSQLKVRLKDSSNKQVAGRNGFCAVVWQSRSDFGEYRLRLVYGIQF